MYQKKKSTRTSFYYTHINLFMYFLSKLISSFSFFLPIGSDHIVIMMMMIIIIINIIFHLTCFLKVNFLLEEK